VIAGLVAVDEPRAGITSGGAVAAPVFAEVARRVLPYLGVAPETTEPIAPAPPAVQVARADALPAGLGG
jgi:hypothetical protein